MTENKVCLYRIDRGSLESFGWCIILERCKSSHSRLVALMASIEGSEYARIAIVFIVADTMVIR
jgi:hypothetical protein